MHHKIFDSFLMIFKNSFFDFSFCCAFVLLNLIELQSLTLKNRTALCLILKNAALQRGDYLYSSVKRFAVSHISVEELRP